MIEKLDQAIPLLDSLPLPAAGETLARWTAFAELARNDLSLTRLAEGHADAVAILAELGRMDLRDLEHGPRRLGVWAAQPDRLRADRLADGWVLSGTKGWCSGSLSLDAALVTATAADGPRLFLVELDDPSITVEPGSWTPLGMVETSSETLHFDDVVVGADAVLRGPNAYVDRPGFGHGGIGVAACWWGGALGLLDSMATARRDDGARTSDLDVALGGAAADLETVWLSVVDAATQIDRRPRDADLASRLALRTRLAVEAMARRVLHLATDALGSEGLCHDAGHAQRIADLTVYLSQLSRRSAARAYVELVVAEGVEW